MADVTGGSRQGASTIAQQFVKNALAEQDNRTVFEKLREAALAYHLTRKWSKQKILDEYLNSIYFGTAPTGSSRPRGCISVRSMASGRAATPTDPTADGTTRRAAACGDAPLPKCASMLAPWEAALLAGMVASPTAFDPVAPPQGRQGPAQPGAAEHAPAGLHQPPAVPGGRSTSRCRPPPTSSSPRSRRSRRTSPAGCAHRSSRRWAWAAACRRRSPSTAPTSAA